MHGEKALFFRGEWKAKKLVFGNDKKYPKMGVSKYGLRLALGGLQAEINGLLVFRPQRKVLYGERPYFLEVSGSPKTGLWDLKS